MKYYSLPADFKNETIDRYVQLNENPSYKGSKVIETYGNITIGDSLGSGRLVRQMPGVDFLDLHRYIEYSKERDIGFNYTLNSPHLRNREFTIEGAAEIKRFLKKLYEIGVRSLTITLPSLMELARSCDLDFEIKASTLCQVNNACKAQALKQRGVDKIVVEEAINRDFHRLKTIREAFGPRVEVIVNQICDQNCLYRMFHYNMISGDPAGTTNQVGIDFYEHRCVLQQLRSIDNLMKLCWVRPEDIKYYTGIGIRYFKLQRRHTFVKGGDPVRTVKAYFAESFDGNLMDLLTMFARLTGFTVFVDNKKLEGFIKPFVEKENFCRYDCTRCNYCETFARESIDLEKAREIAAMAKDFIGDYDSFKKMIYTQGTGTPAPGSPADHNVEFDIG